MNGDNELIVNNFTDLEYAGDLSQITNVVMEDILYDKEFANKFCKFIQKTKLYRNTYNLKIRNCKFDESFEKTGCGLNILELAQPKFVSINFTNLSANLFKNIIGGYFFPGKLEMAVLDLSNNNLGSDSALLLDSLAQIDNTKGNHIEELILTNNNIDPNLAFPVYNNIKQINL